MQARPFIKVRSTNSTATSFSVPSATKTKPSGEGVLYLADYAGADVPPKAKILVFGTDDANETGKARVIGWNRVLHTSSDNSDSTLWVPFEILEVTATLGAMPGIAGTLVDENQLFADTMTVDSEPVSTADTTNDGASEFLSPADDKAAWVKFCTYGAELLEVIFDRNSSSASLNALIQLLCSY